LLRKALIRAGKTSYSFTRYVQFGLNLLVKYGQKLLKGIDKKEKVANTIKVGYINLIKCFELEKEGYHGRIGKNCY
jgi:hypothetical protein